MCDYFGAYKVKMKIFNFFYTHGFQFEDAAGTFPEVQGSQLSKDPRSCSTY